ncbi:MAG: hypothetical protein K8I27_16240 [Planctomycetes bacterium]|nr:hypothetical protein [Planctomycetota bacterium]
MIKKLTKSGNSGALIFDKTMMELLHINIGDGLNITFHNGSMIVTAVNAGFAEEEVESVGNEIASRFKKTFKKLAE